MDNSLYGILAILALLIINAFFVAAEFALVKAKSFRINVLAKEGSKMALLTQRIQGDLESYLAACQLGITMASLGLGWVGEPVVSALLNPVFLAVHMPESAIHPVSFILGFLIFSSLHIVVGEQVPKTFAIRKPEPVSLWIAYPLRWFYLFAFPLNWLLNKASSSILGWFNVKEASHADVLSDDEIRGIINTSEKHGDLDTDKALMLHNMFEFDSHTVEQIMIPRSGTEIIDLQLSWEENLAIMRKSHHSRFPVIDGNPDNPTGIILVKDLHNALIGQDNPLEPAAVLKEKVRKPLLIPETQTIGQLFETMRRSRTHMALAMDEYGSFSGIVTMEDILEEIVGEIADELDTDEADAPARWMGEYWEADGLLLMTDLERVVNIDFADEVDANTITGLFMKNLNRMPRPGDEIEESGLRFLALDVENNRVGQVQIYPLNKKSVPENIEEEQTQTSEDTPPEQ